MAEVLKRFGRYFLLDRLAQGGMAEIYRSRLASAEGAGRIIVIKKIQSGFGENKEFLQMFRSEIKVMLGFNHPNVVQLYDFGDEKGQPYIAMEFVDGKNARQFINQYAHSKQFFPIELAVYIAEQAASGLNYAHTFRDKITGEPLSIVHRDISPQNILISYEGNVKVIDFGIAKATVNLEATRAGIIKGKPSYLSPEQISGESLDGRSDIFALGAVLWELLTGKKLFAGDSDLAILKLIESSNTYVKPPSTINSKIPKELDAIVLKSLAKNRDQRYQTAEEMYRALHRFLYSFSPEFNPADLGYSAKNLFKNDIVEDRKKIQVLNDKAEQILRSQPAEIPSSRGASGDQTKTIGTRPTFADLSARIELDLTKEDQKSKLEVESPTGNSATHAPRTHSSSAAYNNKGATGSNRISQPSYRSASGRPVQTSTSTSSKSGMPRTILIGLAVLGVLVYLAPELGIQIPGMGDSKSASSKKEKASATGITAITANEKMITLNININPKCPTAKIMLNGSSVDPQNPSAHVPLDSPLELSVECDGYKPLYRDFVLNSTQLGGLKESPMELSLEPLHFGYLTVHTTPSAEASIALGSSVWKRSTPVENEKIPVGTYTLILTNKILGMGKNVTVNIEENKAFSVDVRLEIKE